MDEKKIKQKQEREVDVKRVVNAVWRRKWLVCVAAFMAAIITLLGTLFFVKPKYESSAMFYVNNSSISVGGTSLDLTNSGLSASKSLVKSYIIILKTRSTLEAVIDYAGVDQTYESLEKMITAASVDDTEIFKVTVTSTDPVEAEKIANAITYILPKQIDTTIVGSTAKVVDLPIVPRDPSAPSYRNNTLIAFILGLVLSVSVIVVREIFDVTIREESDITEGQDYPILASVPDMNAHSKGGYYRYAYASKGKEQTVKQTLVGKDISFAASEAYKLLRTKLQFSFADGKKCHIIGVSSAMAGEGKSLSSTNIAYSLSELGKNVLLIDCDLRRPSLAEKLPIEKFPGLSNYLSGLCSFEEVVQNCNLPKAEEAFRVVSAGGIAPNPVELLSSDRMSKLLDALREKYDYVILDFPPVGEVSDALALVEKTDGMLLVVRQNHCNRPIMVSTLRQFEFVGARILGIVYNSVRENSGAYGYGRRYYKYGKYGKYSKYGKYGKYSYRYSGAYAASNKEKRVVDSKESSDKA